MVTVVLVSLMAYRTTLSRVEDDSLYLNKQKGILLAGEQEVLIAKLNRLGQSIMTLAALSGTLLLANASLWLWTEFKSF